MTVSNHWGDFKEACEREGIIMSYNWTNKTYQFRFSSDKHGDKVVVPMQVVTDFIVRDEVDLLLCRVKIELLFSDPEP